MSKFVKKAAPVLGAIGGSLLLPGIGTALGSSLGAGATTASILGSSALGGAIGGGIGGGISGGGLKGVGLGALGGAAFGGAGSLAGSAGSAAGITSHAGQAALKSGIQGAALGTTTGDPKNIALGAALGGAGGYLSAGGSVPGLGSAAGADLATTTGNAAMQGPTLGSGTLGTLTQATGGAQPMKLGSLLQAGGKALAYGQGQEDIDEMQQLMARQAGLAEQQFQPYAQAGQQALGNLQAPDMEALQNDPGYQFRLQQGQQALDRSLASRGLGQSGAALKAAQRYGQGLADQTYNDYFGRQSQIAGMGLNSAGGLGSIFGGLGNAQAAAIRAQIENRNRLLGGLGSTGILGGLGGIFG